MIDLTARIAALQAAELRKYHVQGAEPQMACPECGLMRPLTAFWVDKRKTNGRKAICAPCRKRTPGKHKQAWSREEHLVFVHMVGKYTAPQIAQTLGRSPLGVAAYARKTGWSLRLGDYLSTKNLMDLCGVSKDIVDSWKAAGLRSFQPKVLATTPRSLWKFWVRCPEAFDVYSLSEHTLEILGIDLDTWPEPPCFKIIQCSGFLSKYKGWKVSHPTVRFLQPLYENRVACPVCARNLSKYGVGYADEWAEPSFPMRRLKL